MTKRAPGRVRRPRDFYPTPLAAALPVVEWLEPDGLAFAEPCAGDGDLVRHLELAGLRCAYAGDIKNGDDALDWVPARGVEMIVTNPPWHRPLLHALITHFVSTGLPTWLLIDADWAHTRQAAPFLFDCTDIVPIGRVKWIPGSPSAGYDNVAWYRFTVEEAGPTVFHRLL